jgi:uncharacterized protein
MAMSAPLLDAIAPDAAISLVAALAVGAAFGWALECAGLGSARKLIAQFALTDLTVFKVMFSAVVVAMLGSFWLGRAGVLDLSRVYVPETWLGPQIGGGLIFGAGFAIAGRCPGTSCVAAATGRGDGLAVMLGMLGGAFVAGVVFDPLRSLYEGGARGALTWPALLHVPYGAVVFVVVALALAGFYAAETIEGGAGEGDPHHGRVTNGGRP